METRLQPSECLARAARRGQGPAPAVHAGTCSFPAPLDAPAAPGRGARLGRGAARLADWAARAAGGGQGARGPRRMCSAGGGGRRRRGCQGAARRGRPEPRQPVARRGLRVRAARRWRSISRLRTCPAPAPRRPGTAAAAGPGRLAVQGGPPGGPGRRGDDAQVPKVAVQTQGERPRPAARADLPHSARTDAALPRGGSRFQPGEGNGAQPRARRTRPRSPSAWVRPLPRHPCPPALADPARKSCTPRPLSPPFPPPSWLGRYLSTFLRIPGAAPPLPPGSGGSPVSSPRSPCPERIPIHCPGPAFQNRDRPTPRPVAPPPVPGAAFLLGAGSGSGLGRWLRQSHCGRCVPAVRSPRLRVCGVQGPSGTLCVPGGDAGGPRAPTSWFGGCGSGGVTGDQRAPGTSEVERR